MPLKKWYPDVEFSGNKVTPDEIDQDQQYIVLNPSVGTADFGTAKVTGDGTGALVINQTLADYPRAINASILGVAGGMGGTVTVNGVDQFGSVIQESMGFATAAGGGTANGTKIFGKVTSGSVTIAGLGGTAVGSAYIGVAIGSPMLFGLPARLGATTDLKRATWINADVSTPLNINSTGTSASAKVDRSAVSLEVAGGVVAADSYVFTYRSSFNATADGNLFRT